MRLCPTCGVQTAEDARFCANCGAALAAAPLAPAVSAPPAPASKTSATKVIVIVAIIVAFFLAIPFLLIVAAIVIPNLLRARISANEASAVSSIRVIVSAANSYKAAYGHYPGSLQQLGPPVSGANSEQNAGFVDATLAAGTKNGYAFSLQRTEDPGVLDDKHTTQSGPPEGFELNADPLTPSTGFRHFFAAEDGVVRQNRNGPANRDCPPIPGSSDD